MVSTSRLVSQTSPLKGFEMNHMLHSELASNSKIRELGPPLMALEESWEAIMMQDDMSIVK